MTLNSYTDLISLYNYCIESYVIKPTCSRHIMLEQV